MSDKKILIIEKASELFAKKGFEATSVQEITDACGISKGSFYLSFKSKEGLLLSVFEYFGTKLIDRIGAIHHMETTPRKRFEQFFVIQFEEIARYSDFILMQMREQTSPVNEEMLDLMNKMRKKAYETMENLLLNLYGEGIHNHLPDIIVMLNGITHGYIEIIVFNKKKLNIADLASYIVERTDSIISGLTEPFLKKEQLLSFEGTAISITTEELIKDIEMIKRQINDTEDEVFISLDVIGQELLTLDFRKPVISGMMSNLDNSELTEGLVRKLVRFLNR
ncbi:TetR/AcrR family transcriptional regulator [Filibacter tadaridae]|uniref:HTH-type transcriptional repressor KstR2 n=1 Tax=Filibacter tadaridae TaxID=2483811 RepID=A0A3P5XSZ1_9BACL|nr:TetR/AcrR family transcriptional regulator [Filibacter tadaridae]VDC33499.1 HTH-type transcriptional repressor KstR2 [Filibacter tadaridae]